MNYILLPVIALSFIMNLVQSNSQKFTVPELIRRRGYPCEEHFVATEDGYILSIHRIPHGKKSWWRNKIPLIMQHGLLSSSASWVLNTPHKAPAYIMSDAGYDVWLPNIRGNTYSKNHTHLDVSSRDFWQFSWDEMAYYDFPAIVNYIIKMTNQSQLFFIGHSMGTTIYFAAMSRRPQYNNYFKKMYALGPVAHVEHVRSYIIEFSHVSEVLAFFLKLTHSYEFLPDDSLVMRMLHYSCSMLKITEYACENILFLITGFDSKEFNATWFPEITQELLSGTSLNTMLHFCQEYLSGKFSRFDYGWSGNHEHYNQSLPPEYSLKKVTSEVNAIWGINDYLADIYDVNWLLANLPNRGRLCTPIKDKNFNHLDFLWAKEAKQLVYDHIILDMATLRKCI